MWLFAACEFVSRQGEYESPAYSRHAQYTDVYGIKMYQVQKLRNAYHVQEPRLLPAKPRSGKQDKSCDMI